MTIFLKKKEQKKENNGYLLWGLIAVELFMSFSFLGYIHIEPISLTFVYIPVLVAGCILGPKEASLVGAVFGLASMWKASAFYVGAGDAVFSPAMSGKPIQSILLSVGSRTLFGFIAGVLYKMAMRGKHPTAGLLVVSSFGRVLHTIIVYGFMGAFFPEMGFTAANTLEDIKRWDFLISTAAVDLIVFLCYTLRRSDHATRLFQRIKKIDEINASVMRNRRGIAVMLILVLLSSFSVAVYFTNRIGSVMSRYGVSLQENASYDIMHLQIQFLLGMISLALLVVIIVLMYQKNFNYLYYEARLDGLTGLLGRRQFFQVGEGMLGNMESPEEGKTGCFIIMDIDRFKEINDRFGHPEGDRILKGVAENLKRVFGNKGILGRLGGDEFVALINYQMSREEIEEQLRRLREEIGQIHIQEEHVTCSVGVLPVVREYNIDKLYHRADRLLYEAKKQGRDQFVFGKRDVEQEG